MANNIFYTQGDNRAFWIAGYTDNSDLVEDKVNMLNKYQKEASDMLGISAKAIRTFVVPKNSSRRYAFMRVFYGTRKEPPPQAFNCGNEWTMDKWISY